MCWYDPLMADKLKSVDITVTFKNMKEDEIAQALHDEAVERLREIETVLAWKDMSSDGKLDYIAHVILNLDQPLNAPSPRRARP